jgi:CO/xanthine dehydrogenase Mo-binding subunit
MIGGDIRVLRVGNFVALVSTDEALAERAGAAAPALAQWSETLTVSPEQQEASWLEGQPSKRQCLGAAEGSLDGLPVVEGVYSRPYIAHASIGPSCALAEMRDGHLNVWSHGQGMHPLRRTLADALDMPLDSISAFHAQGPGCYGHNGADDAALDAAIIARELPGQCIRVQWRREEEFGFEPFGTAQLVKLKVALDSRGRPQDWTSEIWSGAHVQRPGRGGGLLLAATALPNPPPPPDLQEPPESRGGGATRNAIPLYDIPAHRIDHHLVLNAPVRTSALRGLGALPNVFAIESMLDELAERCDEDPLDYRLSILSEVRASRVVTQVAERASFGALQTLVL